MLVWLLVVRGAILGLKRWRGDAAVAVILQGLVREASERPTPALPRPTLPIPQPKEAWAPALCDKDDVLAIKALAAGKANESQQHIAMAWIVHNAARAYDLPFRPGGVDGQRATDFASGRMFVGQQIVKLINMEMSPNGGRRG